MGVRINIPHFLQHHVNNVKIVDVKGSTVGECLHDLVGQFPSLKERIFDRDGRVPIIVEIYVNGESTFPDELAKPVNDGDEMHILQVPAGG
jgi:molybdopterin converting factor small subunit